MEQSEIKRIVSEYDNLYLLAEEVCEKLNKLDGDVYNTGRYIDDISFVVDEEKVCVSCDNSYRGCDDDTFFSFPMSFLSMTDEELEKGVLVEKQRREEEEKIRREKEQEEQRLDHERRERLQYERLKKKFENQ